MKTLEIYKNKPTLSDLQVFADIKLSHLEVSIIITALKSNFINNDIKELGELRNYLLESFSRIEWQMQQPSKVNYKSQKSKTKVKYTQGFLKHLQDLPSIHRTVMSLTELYEIYINKMCWNEIPKDSDLNESDYILRT